jgi:predicted permease
MVIIGMLITRLGRFNRMQDSAFMISIILVNAANYGIPVNTFAFGTEGQQRALIYYVMSVMVGNTLGVYFASRGEGSVRQALMNVLKVPITYAAVAGLIVNLAQISVPLPIERATSVLAQAAVPGMLVLLGLKLSEATLQVRWKPLLLAVGIRLLLAPMIAFVYATLLGLTGVAFQVAIVQSGMPTAVLANALAAQFHSDGEFTSAATLISTLGSIITLSVIITLLKG